MFISAKQWLEQLAQMMKNKVNVCPIPYSQFSIVSWHHLQDDYIGMWWQDRANDLLFKVTHSKSTALRWIVSMNYDVYFVAHLKLEANRTCFESTSPATMEQQETHWKGHWDKTSPTNHSQLSIETTIRE